MSDETSGGGSVLAPITHWERELIRTKQGDLRSKCTDNAVLFFQNDAEISGALMFNELTSMAEWSRAMPWHRRGLVYPVPVEEDDCVGAAAWLDRHGQYGFTGQSVYSVLLFVARLSRYNPLVDYLNNVEWDGQERLYRWLTDYLGAANTPYTSAIGIRFMISAVARAMRPGCKVDTMLILEGEQGRGKSTSLKVLFGERHFTDDIAEIGTKDAAQQLHGHWCIEMAEMSQLVKVEAKKIKEWLSRSTDKFRLPYGRRPEPFPRTCVAVGTCNVTDGEYLKDETGARRFWPVYVTQCDVDALARDRDQLWAEAMHWFSQGQQWWLTAPEVELAKPEQEGRREVDTWELVLADHLSGTNLTSAEEILKNVLHIEIADQTLAHKKRIGRALRSLNWEPIKIKRAGATYNMWQPSRRGDEWSPRTLVE